jgi:hypothetical protein
MVRLGEREVARNRVGRRGERGKEGGREEMPLELKMSRPSLASLIPPRSPFEWYRWRKREEDVEGRGARLDSYGGGNGKQQSERQAELYPLKSFPGATSAVDGAIRGRVREGNRLCLVHLALLLLRL